MRGASGTITNLRPKSSERTLHTLMARTKGKRKLLQCPESKQLLTGSNYPKLKSPPIPIPTPTTIRPLARTRTRSRSSRAEPIFNCATAKKATAGDASAMKANESDSPWHAVSLTRHARAARGMNSEGSHCSSLDYKLSS